jgi:hypothetical protein
MKRVEKDENPWKLDTVRVFLKQQADSCNWHNPFPILIHAG